MKWIGNVRIRMAGNALYICQYVCECAVVLVDIVDLVILFFGENQTGVMFERSLTRKWVFSPRPFHVLVVSNSQKTFQRASKDSIPEPIERYWVEFFVYFFNIFNIHMDGISLASKKNCNLVSRKWDVVDMKFQGILGNGTECKE